MHATLQASDADDDDDDADDAEYRSYSGNRRLVYQSHTSRSYCN
jgi:hypothetical protein